MKRRTLLRGAAVGAATVPLLATTASASENYQVAMTEQRTNRILVFNKDDAWNESTIKWKWGSTSRGWSNLSDVRFRDTKHFGRVVLAAASGGYAGIITSAGKVLWTGEPGGNPHAIERIPNIAAIVTASSGGYLNVYGPTKITDPSTLAKVQTVNLPGAHGVLWDPSLNVLWAIGDYVVRAYQVTGSYRETRLKDTGKSVALPGGGHDLQPDYTNPGKLVVTDTKAAYEVDTAALTAKVLRAETRIKAFVRHRSGEYLWVRAENVEPRPWSSPTVHFDSGDKTLADAQFYKARIVEAAFE
ncbi:DUF6528 family protein [Stackebrandtia nassauensis]|uniref:Uncharacterized protein n=1 Tax=Stackebrandtia nassauensis (strain DSM 44728 / CIP 108903 / NRRL B-16338 / NBRC 102104 / LLR-40K-21) TaxID=446470 RepID=D3QAE9_STANL|nr:DUF6528 family protein [Stackebrandtia nassauensis]ADD42732.1 hypothetical protein Snas_3061 [Stackebrandtia nassauensis DSM 44728]